MKIALCLSGELRTYKDCSKQIKYHLIDRYGIEDVFCHYWDHHNTMTMWNNPTEIPNQDENPSDVLRELYNPKEIAHEPCPWQMYGGIGPKDEAERQKWMQIIRGGNEQHVEGPIKPYFLDLPDNIRQWFGEYAKAVFHSQKQCALLKQKHGPYDLVIRTRYDIAFNRWLPSLEDLYFKMKDVKILVEWDNMWFYDSETHDLMTIGLYDNMERIQKSFYEDPELQNPPRGNGTLENYQQTWMWLNGLRRKQDGLACGLHLIRRPDDVRVFDEKWGLK